MNDLEKMETGALIGAFRSAVISGWRYGADVDSTSLRLMEEEHAVKKELMRRLAVYDESIKKESS